MTDSFKLLLKAADSIKDEEQRIKALFNTCASLSPEKVAVVLEKTGALIGKLELPKQVQYLSQQVAHEDRNETRIKAQEEQEKAAAARLARLEPARA